MVWLTVNMYLNMKVQLVSISLVLEIEERFLLDRSNISMRRVLGGEKIMCRQKRKNIIERF